MELTFREIQCDDIEALFAVRTRTRENPVSRAGLAALGITPESTAKAIAGGQTKGWLCADAGTVVGFCTGHAGTGEIIVLAVLPTHEAMGIGKRLLTLVSQWLQACNPDRIWLAASANRNTRAYGFYRSLGWRPSGERLENGDEILVLTQ